MNNLKRIVIVGATSAIAEHCARRWLQDAPAELILLGRDAARLERVRADLAVRSPKSAIRTLTLDFLDPDAIARTAQQITAERAVDIVLIAHGSLPVQADCESDLNACRTALDINGVSPVLFAEAFAKPMAAAHRGALALIGSVAGDRGRKSNYVYGAAKGLMTRYAQGLQHRFPGSGIKVTLIKPGPTDTPMTAQLKSEGAKLASVEAVADAIVKAIARGQATVYAPAKWRLIMWVIRHMPAAIFNKLNI